MAWIPIIALPNVDVRCAVEGKFAAIVSYYDERVVALRKEIPALKKYLNSFKDAFRQVQRPSVLMIHSEAPETYRHADAISGFRDALCLSVIPYASAWAIKHNHSSFEPLFGNCFAFYPWTLDRLNEGIIASTPAMLAVHDLDKFAGQSNPEILYRPLDDLDAPLLAKLIERWEARFGTLKATESDTALFRSLNMAYNAAQTPFATAGSLYDTGRLIALWVSAFEILAHVGAGKANIWQVWRLLNGGNIAPKAWATMPICMNLNQWIYQRIYRARNSYLHGNPISDSSLVILPGAKYDLTKYAAVLYRLALAEFLALHREPQWPERGNSDFAEKFAEEASKQMDFMAPQERCEAALRTLRTVASQL